MNGPQGFTLDLGRFYPLHPSASSASLHHVDIRNGFTKTKVAGVKEFEILLGSTIDGPWKSAINGTLVDDFTNLAR